MPVYVVCHRKRNSPRMDARICELKCPLKGECKEFVALRGNPGEMEPPEADAASVRREAA